MTTPRWSFTVAEVAAGSGLSESQIRRMVAKGELARVRTERNSVRIGLGSIIAVWPDAALVLTTPPVHTDGDPTPATGTLRAAS